MKYYKCIVLFLILSMALPGYSQLNQKYTIDVSSATNAAKYQGKKYLYYNMFTYDGVQLLPPMPFQGGRIRDGKYKASATAMNNYVGEFKKNNGKTFTFVKLVPIPDYPINGVVLACETGDTVIVGSNYGNIQEFFSVEYLETEKKKIGQKLYETDMTPGMSSVQDTPGVIPAFLTYSDAKTKELRPSFLPYLSEWTIKDVGYNTTYYGDHSQMNDIYNMVYNRLYYVIENKTYGSLICYFDEQKHTLLKNEAYNQLSKSSLFGYKNFDEQEKLQLEKWAKEGTADMKYFYFTTFEEKGKSKEETKDVLFKLAEQGSVAAAYQLVTLPTYSLDLPYDKLAEAVKKACKPIEKLSSYSKLFMKMGKIVELQMRGKEELDKKLAVGKEMYQLAEQCGADPAELVTARDELQKKYDTLLKQQ